MPAQPKAPYLAECPQLPPFLRRLLNRRKEQPLNVLQRVVLALHLRDCREAVQTARENYLAGGGEMPEE